jgi:hypothetical protein
MREDEEAEQPQCRDECRGTAKPAAAGAGRRLHASTMERRVTAAGARGVGLLAEVGAPNRCGVDGG